MNIILMGIQGSGKSTQGNKIAEVPVFYRNRTYGVSKSRFVHMLVTYTSTAVKLRSKQT